jgi:hypothetical protein
MTAVSTKGVSRVNGTGAVGGGGPVPVPRIVGNRRIRTGGIALATMLLAFGAVLSGIALISVSKTSSYLEVKTEIQVGSPVTAADLTSVQLSGGGQVALIPAADLKLVVGHVAATTLYPNTLLAPKQLTSTAPIPDGDVQIALSLNEAKLSSTSLAPGASITLVPYGNSATATSQPYTVTIIQLFAADGSGDIRMIVQVLTGDAVPIETLVGGSFFVESKPAN